MISEKLIIEDNRPMKEAGWPGLVQRLNEDIEDRYPQSDESLPSLEPMLGWTSLLNTTLPLDFRVLDNASLIRFLGQPAKVGKSEPSIREYYTYYKLVTRLKRVASKVWKGEIAEQIANDRVIPPSVRTMTPVARVVDSMFASGRWATSNLFVGALKPTMKVRLRTASKITYSSIAIRL